MKIFGLLVVCLLGSLTAFLISSLLYLQAAVAAPFDCASNNCGIAMDAPYPNLVVGVIDGVATPKQAAAIFYAARQHGFWHMFPASDVAFASTIEPISISVSHGHSLTVLAATWEARLSNFRVGQLVRFAPHRGMNEKPRPNDPYWVGVGCVIILCGTPYDSVCQASYRPGLYKLSSGAELDSSGRRVVPGGVVVDRFSMLPKKISALQ